MKTISEKRLALKLVLIELLGGKCVDCGLMPHIVAMDFDHIAPSKKEHQMASLLGAAVQSGHSEPSKLLLSELKKCALRCANCHRIKTFVNRDIKKGQPKSKPHKKRWLYK